MSLYYFDIETASMIDEGYIPAYSKNPIACITYHSVGFDEKGYLLYGNTPTILLDDTKSEKQIIQEFLKVAKLEKTWNFVPIGYNLPFDWMALKHRAEFYGFKVPPILEFYASKPCVELKPIAVLNKKLEFRGTGLGTITKKQGVGADFVEMHRKKDYKAIREYVTQEFQETMKALEFYIDYIRKMVGEYMNK